MNLFMFRLLTVACGVCVLSTMVVAQVLDGPLAGKDPARYLSNTGVLDEDASLLEDEQGRTILRLTFHNRSFAEFHRVPIVPGRVYDLSFEARWIHDETVETNPTLYAAFALRRIQPHITGLPAAVVAFLDEEGEPLEQDIMIKLLYGQWQSYRLSFVAPQGAAFLVWKIHVGDFGQAMWIAQPQLTPVTSGGTGKLHLDFHQDKLDVSGRMFGVPLDQLVREAPEGAFIVYTGEQAMIDPIELDHDRSHQLLLRGKPVNESSAAVYLLFLNEQHRPVTRRVELSPSQLDGGFDFTMPDTATSVSLVIQEYWLESLRFSTLND